MTLGRLLLQVHRYAGLATLLFLVVAAATGVALCFEHPLDVLLNPDLFHARTPYTAPVDAPALATAVSKANPRLMPTAFVLRTQRGRAVQLDVAPWPGAAALGFDQVFVDPATGQIQGRRSDGPGFDPAHLTRGIYFLHYTLLAGTAGRWFMAVIALAWFLNNLVGGYLTLPSGAPFWRRWRPVWTVNVSAKLPRLLLDLHRAGGLWLFLAIGITAFTSVALNSYSEVFAPVATALSPPKSTPWDRPAPARSPQTRPRLDFSAAEQAALTDVRRDGVQLRPAAMTYDGKRGLYGLRFTSDGRLDWKGLGPVTYYIGDQDGRLVYVDDPLTDSAGQRFLRALYPLHSGDVGGIVTKLLVCLVGLATVEMAASGLYVWWKKRKPRVAARAARRAARHQARTAVKAT